MTESLFTAQDLIDWLDQDVSDGKATIVEKVVWGWLRPILGADVRPDAVSAELFSWAVELGGIAHENPSGMTAYQLGEERAQYSSERRAEILTEVANGGTSPGGGGTPSGRFPRPRRYPDPARTRTSLTYLVD